jgi:hypothetical protein
MTSTDLTTRRAILAALPLGGVAAVLPSGGGSQVLAATPRAARRSPELAALVKAHRAAYRQFVDRAVHRDDLRVFNTLGRAEERALLAICAYPAVTQSDRRTKGRYLLAIEKRGELDLPEHMEAVLRSML